MRMPKKTKDQWVAALRSGKYRQGRDMLRTPDGRYCCLGVLECMLDGDVEELENEDGSFSSRCMPTTDWLLAHGIYDGNFGPVNISDLAGFNDRGYSFESIAEIIERDVEIISE